MKPTSSEVEVDLSIDVDSKNYDAGADPRVQMKKQVCLLVVLINYKFCDYIVLLRKSLFTSFFCI